MSRDIDTLFDLLNAARSACEFLGKCDKNAFSLDRKTQSAVLHQLMLLGEATKRLSSGFREQHSEIPWREIAGFRDRLIHAYDSVDLDMVWNVLHRRLPSLIKFLELNAPNPER